MKTRVSDKQPQFNPYNRFSGLNVMQPEITLESGEGQAFIQLHNAHVDDYGQLRNDPPLTERNPVQHPIRHVKYFTSENICWIEVRGDGLWFSTDTGVESAKPIYKGDVQVASCMFNQRLMLFCAGQDPYVFNGSTIETNPSRMFPRLTPAFGVTAERRLFISGFPQADTLVAVSRVDREDVFYDDETGDSSQQVTAATYIDIANQLTRADRITGLAQFEKNKLAVFTTSQVLIYQTDVDYTLWQLDSKANVNVGTISHNSIVQVGDDLIFCSAHGVHSLRRSQQNGLTMETSLLSRDIKDLYISYLAQVDNPSHINSYYDEKAGQYHIMFPVSDQLVKRLTLTMPTTLDEKIFRWSTGDTLAIRCADVNSGIVVVGTRGGVFTVNSDYRDGSYFPKFKIKSPVLWLSAMHEMKIFEDLMIQFAGKVKATVTIENEVGVKVISFPLEALHYEEGRFPIRSTLTDFIHHIRIKAQGIRITINGESSGKVLISGFALSRGDK